VFFYFNYERMEPQIQLDLAARRRLAAEMSGSV
jgi:hypothetical protein